MKMKEKAVEAAQVLGKHLVRYSRSIFQHVFVRPFQYVVSRLGSLLERTLHNAKTTGEKVLVGLVIFFSILCISVFSYATFYNLYIPIAEISRPVHLRFSVCPEGVGICSFPTANVSLTERSPIKEILGSGQVYSVIIDMEIPDCPVNRDLGMFMVVLKMFDRFQHVSSISERTALYKYRSLPVRLLTLMVFSPLYFFGIYDEKQVLSVEMFSSYKDDFYHPSAGSTIQIHSHRIQIYSCQLNFYAKFSGLKHLLYYWPITSAVCGILFNFIVCVILFTFALYNKHQVIREFANSLSQENSAPDLNEQLPRKKKKSQVTDAIKKKIINQGTQTRPKQDDDLETYNLPVVQEPADFGDLLDGQDSELMAELRHRRVQ